MTCGTGGIRQRLQRCDGGNCVLGDVRTAFEACNSPVSCYVSIINNSTMDLELVVQLNKIKEDIVKAIEAAIEEVFKNMASNVLNLSVKFNRRKRRDSEDLQHIFFTAKFTTEELVDRDHVSFSNQHKLVFY